MGGKKREIVGRLRNTHSRVIQNRAGIPQVGVFSPILFACVLGSLISGFKEFAIRSTRPTDFLATHLCAFADDLALAIADVSFKDIATDAHQRFGEIERWTPANFRSLSPGKCEGILSPCSPKGLKYIENPPGEFNADGLNFRRGRG